jgi:ATP-dependent DNA helicase DinG
MDESLDVASILGPGGWIARRIAAYEHRPAQLQMAEAIEQALSQRKHLIVEAGTGVGKSYAYLVPAILMATQEEGRLASSQDQEKGEDEPSDGPQHKRSPRVIISTHTISLQEQLIGKDLPLLNAILPREFTSVLVKGRGNYLSIRRMKLALQRATSLFAVEEEYQQLERIESWSGETTDGSLSDLDFRPMGGVWGEVASDSSNCLGRRCPHHQDCYYFRARRRAANAQILVVNHALFFSDLALREEGVQILPDYDAVVFDECHTLESVASEHLGISLTTSQIDFVLRKLYNPRTEKGLLLTLDLKSMAQHAYHCMILLDDLVHDLDQWWTDRGEAQGRVREAWVVKTALPEKLVELAKQLERFGKDHDNENIRQDMMAAVARLEVLRDSLSEWLQQSQSDSVYWLERTAGRFGIRFSLRSSPIDVGPAIRRMLFDQPRPVILTSATLATGRDRGFEFFQQRIGATGTSTLQVGSPFDYQRQAKLVLIDDMPDPSSEAVAYEEALPEVLRRWIGATDGHAFVLFTSFDLLRKMVQRLTPWMAERSLAIYSHADGVPRGQLLEQFKANPRGVLFGADSFWQGVDVPGDALRNVVITKLPFSVPDHPLLEARLDAIRQAGGQPFREYQLPEAVIRLRQGFGRLIRTSTDRGLVVITDSRVVRKSYGRAFLEALPDCPIERRSVSDPANWGF